ncbi:MAG: methyltransferase domain-containing protein [Candidatus Omnitrophota bacterium]
MAQKNHKIHLESLSKSKDTFPSAAIREALRVYYKTSAPYLKQPALDKAYFSGYVAWLSQYAPKGARILDVGCGTGLSSCLLKQNGFEVIGMDISFCLLEKTCRQGLESAEYVVADAVDLPFRDASFDVIGSMSCLEHIPDTEQLLEEMMRVLKRRGFMLIMAPNLLSPFLALSVFFRICFKKKGMPGFASTPREALRLFFRNLFVSLRKKINKSAQFLYRRPDLSCAYGGDVDGVYLACQIDLKNFFTNNKWEIIEYATNKGIRSCWAKIITKVFPDFCGACSIVVRKP